MACKPDVCYDTRPFEYGHIDRLSRHEPVHIEILGVPAGLLIARNAAIASFRKEAHRTHHVAERLQGGLRSVIFLVINPHCVVHVCAGVFISHVSVATAVIGITENQHASPGLFGTVLITYDQNTVSVENALWGRRSKDVVFPLDVLWPAKAPTDRPLPTEHAFDRSKLLLGQTRIRIPGLNPV